MLRRQPRLVLSDGPRLYRNDQPQHEVLATAFVEGFRLATRNEVLQLFHDPGASGMVSGWNPSDAPAASQLLSLAGTTLPQLDLDRSWMFYDASTEPSLPASSYVLAAVFGIRRAQGGDQGTFTIPGIFPLRDYSSGEMASAMVRVVPEPSVSLLFLIAVSVTLASPAALHSRSSAGARKARPAAALSPFLTRADAAGRLARQNTGQSEAVSVLSFSLFRSAGPSDPPDYGIGGQ